MSNHSLLTQKHADSMVGRIAKAHRSEKAEAHARLLDVLVSLEEAGQAHLLGVIADKLPDAEVIEMLLSKPDLAEMLSSRLAAVALLDCLLALMATAPDRLEPLQALFALVLREEEGARRDKLSGSEDSDQSQEFLGSPEQLPPLEQQDEEPLRVQYVRLCRDKIEAGGSEADASFGLLHQILDMCRSLKQHGTISAQEYDETFSQLNPTHDTSIVTIIIDSFKAILEQDLAKPTVMTKLQPRLALLTALIQLSSHGHNFGIDQLENLLLIFIQQHPDYFDVFLEWFSMLASSLDSQLTRHAFLLLSEHEHFGKLSLTGFNAFKQLFIQVNELEAESTAYTYSGPSLSVSTLALDGLAALWKAALSGSGEAGEAARTLLRTVYFEYSVSTNGSHDQLLLATFRCLGFCSLALSEALPDTTQHRTPDEFQISGSPDQRRSFDPVELIGSNFTCWSVPIAENALALLEECLKHTEHEQQCPSHHSSHFGTPLQIEVDTKRLVSNGGSGVGTKPHSWESSSFTIVTHTNATVACFKASILEKLGFKGQANAFLKFGGKYDPRGDQDSTPLKGSTLAQAGLIDGSLEYKVYATLLPQTTLPQPAVTPVANAVMDVCLLYTSDAADEEDSVDLGGRRIIKKKKKKKCITNILVKIQQTDR
eukprot:TRINITY_DN5344_c0_g1_i1.p1 TRINITY_DN5344_c0_g1~~TRINITY_DN5344_c0_g1_i1.p1  ORF type:complete len:655 (-),score=209.36 TRINITY_DN5344_c0_g1_i1:70-2034(-)